MSAPSPAGWLGLAEDPWPPDHYTLLGLRHGEHDADVIERHVLERLEKVRRYQLTHPETATEVMTLLASAFICLSDPRQKQIYDRERGIAPPEPPAEAAPPTAASPDIESPPEAPPDGSETRRRLHHQAQQVKQLVSVWEQLGKVLGDAERSLTRRSDVRLFRKNLAYLLDLQKYFPPSLAEAGQPGYLILVLARSEHRLALFRQFGPAQRELLAWHWQAGREMLLAHQDALRAELRTLRETIPPLTESQDEWVTPGLVPAPESPSLLQTEAVGMSETASAAPTVRPPLVPEERRAAAAALFWRNSRAGEEDYDVGAHRLQACCRLDPANLVYRHALRTLQKKKYPAPPQSGWLPGINALSALARLAAAKQVGDWLKVLEYGEEVLTHNPWDLGTTLTLAEAADRLGLPALAVWLLEQVWRRETQAPALVRALVRLHEKGGNFARGKELLNLVLDRNPQDHEARRLLREMAARERAARDAADRQGQESE
jgi:hypothetical protein